MDGEDTCMLGLLCDGANAPQYCARRHSATVARAAAVEEADRHVIVRDRTDELMRLMSESNERASADGGDRVE